MGELVKIEDFKKHKKDEDPAEGVSIKFWPKNPLLQMSLDDNQVAQLDNLIKNPIINERSEKYVKYTKKVRNYEPDTLFELVEGIAKEDPDNIPHDRIIEIRAILNEVKRRSYFGLEKSD